MNNGEGLPFFLFDTRNKFSRHMKGEKLLTSKYYTILEICYIIHTLYEVLLLLIFKNTWN